MLSHLTWQSFLKSIRTAKSTMSNRGRRGSSSVVLIQSYYKQFHTLLYLLVAEVSICFHFTLFWKLRGKVYFLAETTL